MVNFFQKTLMGLMMGVVPFQIGVLPTPSSTTTTIAKSALPPKPTAHLMSMVQAQKTILKLDPHVKWYSCSSIPLPTKPTPKAQCLIALDKANWIDWELVGNPRLTDIFVIFNLAKAPTAAATKDLNYLSLTAHDFGNMTIENNAQIELQYFAESGTSVQGTTPVDGYLETFNYTTNFIGLEITGAA